MEAATGAATAGAAGPAAAAETAGVIKIPAAVSTVAEATEFEVAAEAGAPAAVWAGIAVVAGGAMALPPGTAGDEAARFPPGIVSPWGHARTCNCEAPEGKAVPREAACRRVFGRGIVTARQNSLRRHG